MSTPAARIGDTTITGDTITGPGIPTVIIGGKPASIQGDLISGTACTGSIIEGSVTVLIGGLPAARVGSKCIGVNSAGTSSTTVGTGEPSVMIE